MKNTVNKSKIINMNYKKIAIKSGIAISSLLLYISPVKAKTIERTPKQNHIESQEEIDDPKFFWQTTYKNIYENLNIQDFDEEFLNVYNNIQYIIIDEKEYPINNIQVKQLENTNEVHFTYTGKNRIDLFTNESFTGKLKSNCDLKDSTIFYQLYCDGYIKEDKLMVTSEELQKYGNKWDGKIQTQTPDLMAEQQTNEIFKKKYGR